MTVQLQSLPQTGRVEIDIKVTSDINVSGYSARQKVDNFVLSEISYMMHAGEPNLIVADALYWRVPVILSLASRGDVGEVAMIDVNAQTGQLTITPQLIDEVSARAEGLAAHFTSATAE